MTDDRAWDLREIVQTAWDIAKWWASWRALFLLAGLVAGAVYGHIEDARRVTTYTAEAIVFIRDWRGHLQNLADRAKIDILIPMEVPFTGGFDRNGNTIKFKVTGTSESEALAAAEREVTEVSQHLAKQDEGFEPYAQYLREHGITEFAMSLRRLEVIRPPYIAKRETPIAMAVPYSFLGLALALVVGLLWFFTVKEGRELSAA